MKLCLRKLSTMHNIEDKKVKQHNNKNEDRERIFIRRLKLMREKSHDYPYM